MEPLDVMGWVLIAATLIVVFVPWLRSRSYRVLSRRPFLAAVNWTLVLLYVVLTFVAVDLSSWVVYHLTFGRVNPGPSDDVVLLAGLAAVVMAAGGVLLPFYRLTAAVMALAGLTVAIVAFASGLPPSAGIPARIWVGDVVGIGFAIAGMLLVVRSARA